MNKIILIGRLAKEPEFKTLPGEKNVCKCTLAVERQYLKNGKREVDFIPLVMWNKMAINVFKYKHKGNVLGVSGRLQIRSYEAKDGSKKYLSEVICDDQDFIVKDSATSSQGSNQTPSNEDNGFNDSIYGEDITPVDDGDIPF